MEVLLFVFELKGVQAVLAVDLEGVDSLFHHSRLRDCSKFTLAHRTMIILTPVNTLLAEDV